MILAPSPYILKPNLFLNLHFEGCPRGIMVNATNSGIVVNEFELKSRYYIHFRTNIRGKRKNPLILPAMG